MTNWDKTCRNRSIELTSWRINESLPQESIQINANRFIEQQIVINFLNRSWQLEFWAYIIIRKGIKETITKNKENQEELSIMEDDSGTHGRILLMPSILMTKHCVNHKDPSYHLHVCLHTFWILGWHFYRSLQVHKDERACQHDLDFHHKHCGSHPPAVAIREFV